MVYMANRLMWANVFSPNLFTLSGIHCIILYFYLIVLQVTGIGGDLVKYLVF